MRQLVLADDLTVYSLNHDETRFVYHEVFSARCYLQHGIELQDGDCIFDVGANIGLSALFFHRECPNVRIYAFEPSPVTFECLKANIELHKVDARLFECGLARESGTAEFSFYPFNTVMSGFHADVNADRSTFKSYLVNKGVPPQNVDRLLGFFFKKVTYACRLRTLSEIIEEERIAQIGLLKVDVEKSERNVLAGIRDEHWSLIRQLVIEISDGAGCLDEITRLLTQRGFRTFVEQDPLLAESAIFMLFAIRAS
jgi:31-O-methyltransferase